MLTFAKGWATAWPSVASPGGPDLMDAVHANSISTFGGNPLATAGGARQHRVPAVARPAGQCQGPRAQLMDRLAPLAGKLPSGRRGARPGPHDRRRTGPARRPDPGPGRGDGCAGGLPDRLLLVGKGGVHGNVLRIAPPLSVTSAEIDTAAAALTDTLLEVDAARRLMS